MKYPAYSEYKDSGVEWLGDVPEHWITKKMKFMARIKNGRDYKGFEIDEDGYPVIGSGGQFAFSDKYLFNGESVLLGRKGNIDKPLYVDGKFWTVDTMFYTQIFDNTVPKFLYYSSLTIRFDFYSTNTAVPSMTQEDLGNNAFTYPSRSEQTTIANFLDCETTKIDTLINKQQKLISLLQEKRQAVISHAVTKGINPDAKMKDSGVEWLGEVPEHWETKRIKFLFEIRKRISGEHGHKVLSITQQGIKVKDIESGEGQLSMDYSKYQFVEVGDYAMNHMDLLTGFVDISKYHGVTSPDYRVFTLVDKHADPIYYLYLLQMGYIDKIFYAHGQGSSHLGRWRFQTEKFKSFIFPYPPITEQIEIASTIKSEHGRITQLIDKCTTAIKLMQERRTALISAAVTGKIDVRNA